MEREGKGEKGRGGGEKGRGGGGKGRGEGGKGRGGGVCSSNFELFWALSQLRGENQSCDFLIDCDHMLPNDDSRTSLVG